MYDHTNVSDLKAHEIIISPAFRLSIKSSRQQYTVSCEEQKKTPKSQRNQEWKLIREEVT